MKRRKFLLGSTAFSLSGAALLTGTSAYSQSELDRDVQIEVVSDSEGYLGLNESGADETEYLFGDGEKREAPESFEITNQTTTTVEVDLSLKYGNFVFNEPQDSDLPKTLGPGESIENVEVSLPEGMSDIDVLVFDIDSTENSTVEIYAERELIMENPADFSIYDIEFQRNGNQVKWGSYISKKLTVWTEKSGNGDVEYEEVAVQDDNKVNNGDLEETKAPIIAVSLDDSELTTHPNWKGDEFEKAVSGYLEGCVVAPSDFQQEKESIQEFLTNPGNFPYCNVE